MQIVNKVLLDKTNLTYTYFLVCKKCGYSTTVDKRERYEIEASQLPCDLCEKPIPQVIVPVPEPMPNIGLRTPDNVEIKQKQIQTQEKINPVKISKPHKKNRKK
jgi:hypothetical protein